MNWESRPNSHNRNLKHRHATTGHSRLQRSESKRRRAVSTTITISRWIHSIRLTLPTRIANLMSPTIEREMMELCWRAIRQSRCEFKFLSFDFYFIFGSNFSGEMRVKVELVTSEYHFWLVLNFNIGLAAESTSSTRATARRRVQAIKAALRTDPFRRRPTTTPKAIELSSWSG